MKTPGSNPTTGTKSLHTFRVMLDPSAPGATIIDMDIETATELDDQISLVVEPSRSWSMPSRLSPA